MTTHEPPTVGLRSAEQDNTPKLSRQAQRAKERMEKETVQVYTSITEKFLSFFIDHENPESEEIEARVKQLSAQWRLYCKRKNFLPIAFPMVDDYCKGVIAEYHESKKVAQEAQQIQ